MKYLLLSTALMGLSACSSDNNDSVIIPPEAEIFTYKVSMINLTNGQPLSPPASILHSADNQIWAVGKAASDELEKLAEGGDSSSLLNNASGLPTFGSSEALLPGTSQEFNISTMDGSSAYLTLTTMLVNTNDAFTGLSAVNLGNMEKGDQRTYYTLAYDAGTEFNDELAANIPGPAGDGEGFNANRNDVTAVVTHHGGVVSQDDGYPESALTEAQRFDNPVLRVAVTRQ